MLVLELDIGIINYSTRLIRMVLIVKTMIEL